MFFKVNVKVTVFMNAGGPQNGLSVFLSHIQWWWRVAWAVHIRHNLCLWAHVFPMKGFLSPLLCNAFRDHTHSVPGSLSTHFMKLCPAAAGLGYIPNIFLYHILCVCLGLVLAPSWNSTLSLDQSGFLRPSSLKKHGVFFLAWCVLM